MAEGITRSPTEADNLGKEFRTLTTPGGSTGTVHARVTGLTDAAGNVLTFPTADPAAGTPAVPVRAAGPFAVTGPLTRAQVDASPLPVAWTGAPTVTISGTASVNVANASLVVRGQINVAGVGDAVPVILAGQSGSVAVTTGGLTNGELRATPLSVAVNNFPATQPVSLAALPSLAAGGNTIGKVDVNGTVPVSGAFYPATQPVSGPLTNAELRATAVPVSGTLTLGAGAASIGSVSVSNFPAGFNVNNFPATQAVSLADNAARVLGTVDPTDRAARLLGVITDRTANLSGFSGTSGATAGTLTIPAPGAGLFIYLEYLEVTLYATAARAGAAAPVTVATTNLPGNPSLTFTTAGAIGTSERQILTASHPIRSATNATAVTLSFPAVTGALWRVNAFYWTGS